VELAPVSEVILDEAAITRFRQNYRIEFGAAGTDDPLYEAVSAGRKHAGMEHWLPFFHDRLETLFDYLPGAPVLLDDQVTPARLAAGRRSPTSMTRGARRWAQEAGWTRSTSPAAGAALPRRRGWEAALGDRRVLQLRRPAAGDGARRDRRGRAHRARTSRPSASSEKILSLFGASGGACRARRKAGQVVIASYSEGARERLAGASGGRGLTGRPRSRLARRARARGRLPRGLAAGARVRRPEGPDRHLRTGRARRPPDPRPRKKRRAENFLTEAQPLAPATWSSMSTTASAATPGSRWSPRSARARMPALEYAGGDRLYLPVENIELLTAASATRRGCSTGWAAGPGRRRRPGSRSASARSPTRLIRVAAERACARPRCWSRPTGMWDAFSARFPYAGDRRPAEGAIEDVLEDLAAGIADGPADLRRRGLRQDRGGDARGLRRRHVGRAGGGHRAHDAARPPALQELRRTLPGLPGEGPAAVALRLGQGRRRTREGIADGTVDIVIGTHALLAKGIRSATSAFWSSTRSSISASPTRNG
jgi:transcription-repair coupling factor (superfamily II helicase)